jgi:hypothetical protein
MENVLGTELDLGSSTNDLLGYADLLNVLLGGRRNLIVEFDD